jgi:hypothetical protein
MKMLARNYSKRIIYSVNENPNRKVWLFTANNAKNYQKLSVDNPHLSLGQFFFLNHEWTRVNTK